MVVSYNNTIPAVTFPKGRKQNNKSPEYTTLANTMQTCITMVAVQNVINCKKYGILIFFKIKYLYKSYVCEIVIQI